MYSWEIDQKGAKPSYEDLRKLVDTKIETSRVAKAAQEYDITTTRKYGASLKSESVNKRCKYWESRGVCNRGDDCAFEHDPQKKAKPKGTSPGKDGGKGKEKGNRSSSPKGGKGGRKGKSRSPPRKRGTSLSGQDNKPLCRYYALGKCDRDDGTCNFYHPKICSFYKKGNGKHGDK